VDEEQISKDLIAYLRKNSSADRLPAELTLDFPLLDSGAIDSLELFKLIAHVEDEFKMEISPEKIAPENFADIRSIVRLIQGHLA